MKKYIFLAIVIFSGVFALAFLKKQEMLPEGPYVKIKDAVFSVEIADTPALQEKGLGYRDTLCERCGMLFLFDRADRIGFWMKGMRFPIDILWIRDETIVHIEREVNFHDQQKVYSPNEPANRVLEVNAGLNDRFGIREGDRVSFDGM